MTLNIEPDKHRVAAWQAKAASQGLTVEAWLKKLADEASIDLAADEIRQKKQAAAARIREISQRTKPDPEGWTIKDYINYGRP